MVNIRKTAFDGENYIGFILRSFNFLNQIIAFIKSHNCFRAQNKIQQALKNHKRQKITSFQ